MLQGLGRRGSTSHGAMPRKTGCAALPMRPLPRARLHICRVAEADVAGSHLVSSREMEAFRRDGFLLIPGVFSEDELQQEIDEGYNMFLRGEIEVQESSNPMYNVMMPQNYYPKWKNNLVEQRCKGIAQQLLGQDTELDFDQILAKRPKCLDSVLPWHQDAAYLPQGVNADGAAANFWVAVSDVPIESGCMRYIPGSHLGNIRKHTPVDHVRDETLDLGAPVGGERAEFLPMKRGDVLIHTERVVHGSGPNMSDKWRCAYVLNFKKHAVIQQERAMGFDHSQRRHTNWEKNIKN